MQKAKWFRYCLFFVFTLLVYNFAGAHFYINDAFRSWLIAIPLLLSVLFFSCLNKEKFELCWLRLLICVAVSTGVFLSVFLTLNFIWNKVYNIYFISTESIVWATRISFDVLLVLLGAVLFYFILLFSGKNRIEKIKLSKQFICAMFAVVLLTILITLGIEICTPRVLASKIAGDFGIVAGFRYIRVLEFLLEAASVSAMWVVAIWADFCLNHKKNILNDAISVIEIFERNISE